MLWSFDLTCLTVLNFQNDVVFRTLFITLRVEEIASSGRAISLLFLITSQPETFQCSCRHRPKTVRLNRDRASDGLWEKKVDRGTRETSESSSTQRRNWLCYWTWHHHYWRGSSWPSGSRRWSPTETGHPSFKQSSSLVATQFFCLRLRLFD